MAEPRFAHAAGEDGLDIVRKIIGSARAHLTEGGALIFDVGVGRGMLGEEYPDLVWVGFDLRESEGEVFFIRAEDLPVAKRRGR